MPAEQSRRASRRCRDRLDDGAAGGAATDEAGTGPDPSETRQASPLEDQQEEAAERAASRLSGNRLPLLLCQSLVPVAPDTSPAVVSALPSLPLSPVLAVAPETSLAAERRKPTEAVEPTASVGVKP